MRPVADRAFAPSCRASSISWAPAMAVAPWRARTRTASTTSSRSAVRLHMATTPRSRPPCSNGCPAKAVKPSMRASSGSISSGS